jgi:hypothetical protein
MTGQILLALDGDLARAGPETLRYRVLHAAARLVRGGRRRCLEIQATWPWAEAITTAWQRIDALPHAPLTSTNLSLRPVEGTAGLWKPRHPAGQPGHSHTRKLPTAETSPSGSYQPR